MKVIIGNKDVIELLETALAEAKAGTLVGVIVCGITEGDGLVAGGCGWRGAVRDDVAFPWPRLQATVDTAQADLVRDGTSDWR